ncbi:MAG: tyrosine-type recombinase/integrase [Stomatobaculum sp.]|nr:tyrosine-type recombinase/integrase [Stomatobaculum sp.]
MASGSLNYSEKVDQENIRRLREMIAELPPYCRTYFRGIEPRTQSRTRIAYAYDLRIFFQYLMDENPVIAKCGGIRNITLDMLSQLTPTDIEEYMEYLKYRPAEDNPQGGVMNRETGVKRKVSSLKSFYKYLYQKEMVENDPAARVLMPKLHEKEIIRLDVDEVALMLDQAESGDRLTERQKAFHEKTKIRDLAILTLLLGTGIRVSECVGLDVNDVDFRNDGVRVHRKGGKEQVVYFGDEVEEALLNWLEEREHISPAEGSEEALFLSLQNRRMNVRSVENMVKKYARTAAPLKKITPHKLRSTYGTSLYRETGDIYLVADVLGHNDVNTTRKHYAALQEDRRRSARNKVRLREDPES